MAIKARTKKGRPRSFDEGQVLDAALELFWTRGYRETTLRDLEAQVGVRQSSLYNAFGPKQQLLDAALSRYEARIDDELVRPLEESGEGLDAVADFFRSLGAWIRSGGRRGCMVVNMMAEDGGDTVGITRRTRGYRQRVRQALIAALRRAQASGATTDDVEARADLLLAVVLGLNVAARGGASHAELSRMLDGTVAEVRSWRA